MLVQVAFLLVWHTRMHHPSAVQTPALGVLERSLEVWTTPGLNISSSRLGVFQGLGGLGFRGWGL